MSTFEGVVAIGVVVWALLVLGFLRVWSRMRH